ncbi:MAG: site-specific DNA-methyltransferase [Negativicutes bacterium]|nr:site-specific DNA-methyltransferase [Negativicutes bacterium]
MKIKSMNITDLKPAKYNPRKDLKPGDKEFEQLKKSIVAFGYVDPIIVNSRNNVVIGGHQRLKVLAELGNTKVDVSVVDLDEKNEKALNVALNKISGEWDMPILQDILFELNTDGFDMDSIGFSLDDLAKFTFSEGEASEDDFDVDKAVVDSKEPVSKPGDLYELGNHRLLCGDATKQADALRLMNGKEAGMVFTDPPYNVDYTGGTEEQLKIQNDKMSDTDFYKFLLESYKNMFEAVAPGGAIYVCHADTEGLNFRKAMLDAGWLLKQCIIWVKNSLVMGRQDYHWQHEPLLYGWKPGAAHTWYGGRKQTTTWEIDRPSRSSEHPTTKPIELCARAINNSSRSGDIVLDLFGGSGSTLIAAEQTGRTCYTMELDPVYTDVIVNRYYQNFPEMPIKRNGVPVDPASLFK